MWSWDYFKRKLKFGKSFEEKDVENYYFFPFKIEDEGKEECHTMQQDMTTYT